MKRKLRNKSGFTFVELMVAVVILAIGLVFIIEGYIQAAGAFNTSSIRIQLVPLLEAKMFELESAAETDNGIARGSSQGEFSLENRNASWELEVNAVEKEEELDLSDDLNQVELRVSWFEKSLPRQITIATYLKNKKAE